MSHKMKVLQITNFSENGTVFHDLKGHCPSMAGIDRFSGGLVVVKPIVKSLTSNFSSPITGSFSPGLAFNLNLQGL